MNFLRIIYNKIVVHYRKTSRKTRWLYAFWGTMSIFFFVLGLLVWLKHGPTNIHVALHSIGYAQTELPAPLWLPAMFPLNRTGGLLASDGQFNDLAQGFDVCKSSGLVRRSSDSRTVKVWDLIIFNRELDMLELRLNELANVVDGHIIVEGPRSWTGMRKPLFAKEAMNEPRFAKHKDRIVLINYDPPVHLGAWAAESHARGHGWLAGLQAAKASEGDLLIIADADELPRPELLALLKTCSGWQGPICSDSDSYYISFEFRNRLSWSFPRIIEYTKKLDSELYQLRHYKPTVCVPNGGWHCSYCFPKPDDLVNKLESNAHTRQNEKNRRYWASHLQELKQAYCEGHDVLKGGDHMGFSVQRTLNGLPKYILENQDKFNHLLPGNCTARLFKEAVQNKLQ